MFLTLLYFEFIDLCIECFFYVQHSIRISRRDVVQYVKKALRGYIVRYGKFDLQVVVRIQYRAY